MAPREPDTSMRSAFLRPVLMRDATKAPSAPSLEASAEEGDVVDGDGAETGARGAREPAALGEQGALGDHGVDGAGDAREALAGDELGEVDGVGADVAERARTGVLLLQAPREGRGLVDEPVLQVLGAHVAHVADGAARRRGRGRTWPPGRGGR